MYAVFFTHQWLLYNLKQHISDEILFHQPTARSQCYIVTRKDIELANIVEQTNILPSTGLLSDIDTGTVSSCDEAINISTTTTVEFHMNHAALVLRALISTTSSDDIPWPPSAKDLDIDQCMRFVPPCCLTSSV